MKDLEIPEGERLGLRGTKLFVRSFGSAERTTILAIHGGPGGSHEKLLGLQELANAFHVVLYDQRGTGQSDRFESIDSAAALELLSLDQNIEDIEALRAHLGKERLILLGHSWGAALATFYAAKYPSRVERLIVYSGGPEDRELADEKERRHAARRSDAENVILKVKARSLEEAIAEGKSQDELDLIFSELVGVAYPSLYFQPPQTFTMPS
jgi:proline-specific peptidase